VCISVHLWLDIFSQLPAVAAQFLTARVRESIRDL
jgi:hypothetical protein